jgi:predicted RNA binding protein YcfA (HicA-like mRNA interferase family)
MAGKVPVLKAREVLRALLRGGFYIHHQTGSHARLLHNTKPELRVTVPIHSKDVPPSLLKRIPRQASLSEEEFRKLI